MTSADATRAPQVLCVGIAVLDQIFRVEQFPVQGLKSRANAFATSNGGCASNAAIAVARLGGRVRRAGPLGGPAGEDATGDRILAGFAREGVDASGSVRVEGVPSPVSLILLDARGERTIVTYRDPRLNAVRPADPDRLVGSANAVLADNRFPDFALPVCRAARAHGIPVVLDADMPARPDDALLDAASHIIFSAEGLRATAGCDDLARGLLQVARGRDAFFAVTDGANDILWVSPDGIARMAAFKADVVDTIGAGDVFHGAFALALAEGQTEVGALRFAAAAASVKCTRFGGIAGAPSRAEAETLLLRVE